MQTDCFSEAAVPWPKRPISAIAAQSPRYPIKRGQDYPFVEMASVAENFRGILKFETRKPEGSGLTRFKMNDTLFAKITPCPENGKIAFVDKLAAETGLGSTEFIVLSPLRDTCPRFLYHLVSSHPVRGRAVSRMEGSTGRQRIPDDVFERRLLVPIPSPPEQELIAKVLDAVDATIERTTVSIQCATLLKQTLTQEFFTSALGNTAYANRPTKPLPPGWSLVPTSQLILGEPKNGVSPPTFSQPPGTPTFSIAAIREGMVDLARAEHLKYATLRAKIAEKFRIAKGDILIVRGNANSDLVGKAGRITTFPNGCIYPDITMRVKFREDIEHPMTPEFAVLTWNHSIVHNQILRRAKTSNGTLKINKQDVKQMILPVPPLYQQERITDLVAACDEKGAALMEKLRSLDQLKKSLMHDLLTGTVRVDPNLFKEKEPA